MGAGSHPRPEWIPRTTQGQVDGNEQLPTPPYADLIGLEVAEQRAGYSRCTLTVADLHHNPHRVVHGAMLYALADTGMGAALYPTLAEGEICATIQITMNYFKPVREGAIECVTELVNRGKSVANRSSRITADGVLVASANRNYAISRPGSAR